LSSWWQVAARLGRAVDLLSERVIKPSGFLDHLTRNILQRLGARGVERVSRLGGERPDALEVEMGRCRTTLCVGVLLTSCNPTSEPRRKAASLSESSTNIGPVAIPIRFRDRGASRGRLK
jgi:hypothetical protein